MRGGKTLSPVPPPRETSRNVAVRLGLVLTAGGRSLPFELVFCSSDLGKDSECFLVRVGARSAVCRHCRSRHKVIGLLEALEEREIALGGEDGAWPIIMPELFLGVMIREIQEERAGCNGRSEAPLTTARRS